MTRTHNKRYILRLKTTAPAVHGNRKQLYIPKTKHEPVSSTGGATIEPKAPQSSVETPRATPGGSRTRGQSAHPKIPLEKFSPSGGVSSGILPSRGILKNIILCRHKTFNPPEGLIPCMPCRGKTYKIPLAFFSISTPAGFNLVENSGGKT